MKELFVYSSVQKFDWKDFIIGSFVACLLVFIFYPGFALLQTTPMHASSWELMDPIVSSANFEPSFDEFQRELYTNHNILWSSLRSMGMPMLAVDIQAAPLFPLTLLLSWLKGQQFWVVFTVLQLVLMALGVYLLARRFFHFTRFPSILFVLCFVYSLYVLRWMNHPWMNGLLAGIYYLYFLCLICEQSKEHNIRRLFAFIGLTISVYAMVTCGFPESALMSAFLVVFTYVPFVISKALAKEISWRSYLPDIFLGHLAGFALSSYQIFSVLELLRESGISRERGLLQYSATEMLPFFLECLTQFSTAAPVLFKDSRTFLGLLPLMFFIIGIGGMVKHYKKISYGEIGAALCGLFILFKLFDIGPAWFNIAVASLPLTKETYFFVYFFTLFLWFFSYFSAKGFHYFLYFSTRITDDFYSKWRATLIVVQIFVVALVLFAATSITGESIRNVVLHISNYSLLKVLLLFGVSIICIHFYLSWSKNKGLLPTKLLAAICLILIIAEIKVTLPDGFSTRYGGKNFEIQRIINYLETNNIPLWESRISDPYGSYVSEGLATVDTGDAPLLSNRLVLFRNVFFDVYAGGHQPIKGPRHEHSWRITSTNIKTMDRYYGDIDPTFPKWETMQKIDGVDTQIHLDHASYNKIDLKKPGAKLLKGNYQDIFHFRGWGVGNLQESSAATSTFLIFKSESEEFVIPTIKVVRHDVARHLGHSRFNKAGFLNYMSPSFLKTDSYKIFVRMVTASGSGYYEHDTGIVVSYKNKNAALKKTINHAIHNDGSEMDFIGVLRNSYIYYDSNALPRAYIATACKNFDNVNTVIAEIKKEDNFTLGEVYVEGLDDKENAFCRDYSSEVSQVPILFDHGDKLRLEEVRGPAIVVVNDNIYPGWQATDLSSGEKISVQPGNITFRTLILPEEKGYRILLEYKPKWLLFANISVFLGFIVLLSVTGLTVLFKINRPTYK